MYESALDMHVPFYILTGIVILALVAENFVRPYARDNHPVGHMVVLCSGLIAYTAMTLLTVVIWSSGTELFANLTIWLISATGFSTITIGYAVHFGYVILQVTRSSK